MFTEQEVRSVMRSMLEEGRRRMAEIKTHKEETAVEVHPDTSQTVPFKPTNDPIR